MGLATVALLGGVLRLGGRLGAFSIAVSRRGSVTPEGEVEGVSDGLVRSGVGEQKDADVGRFVSPLGVEEP